MKSMLPFFFILAISISLLAGCSNESNEGTKDMEDERDRREEKRKRNSDRAFLRELDLDSVKNQYGERFEELRAIINRHDPIVLLDEEGTPKDEYDPEVKTLIVQIDSNMSEKELHDRVFAEFRHWFGGESVTGPKERYRELSEEIHEWLRNK